MAAAGEIAAAVYNTNRAQASDPVLTAADFVPKPLGDEQEADENEPGIDEVAEFFGARKPTA